MLAEAIFVTIPLPATWAVGSVKPMAGIQVILQNQQVLDIEYAVFEENHDGLVTVNDTEDYSCL